jgi:hypothetical protein
VNGNAIGGFASTIPLPAPMVVAFVVEAISSNQIETALAPRQDRHRAMGSPHFSKRIQTRTSRKTDKIKRVASSVN